MNTVITSREQILACALELAQTDGLPALNMRSVAKACGVAVGSLYNYFPSKGALLSAVVGEIWRGIFHGEGCDAPDGCPPRAGCFISALERIFTNARRGADSYPDFIIVHARLFSSSEKTHGRDGMDAMFAHMRDGLIAQLERDPLVRQDAFDGDFSRDELIDFAFDGIMALLIRKRSTCDALTKIIRRLVY